MPGFRSYILLSQRKDLKEFPDKDVVLTLVRYLSSRKRERDKRESNIQCNSKSRQAKSYKINNLKLESKTSNTLVPNLGGA